MLVDFRPGKDEVGRPHQREGQPGDTGVPGQGRIVLAGHESEKERKTKQRKRERENANTRRSEKELALPLR